MLTFLNADLKYFIFYNNYVIFIKCLTAIIIIRNFGNIIHDVANNNNNIMWFASLGNNLLIVKVIRLVSTPVFRNI